MTGRIVVIGADAAGMSAASQAKRIAGDAVQIVAFERGTYSSYSACGIPCWVAGDVDEPGARAVAAQHLRGGPAVQLHQVPLGAAAVQPGVAEVMPEPVRPGIHPGLRPRRAIIW